MSYRGRSKGSYGNQKRGYSSGYSYSTKKQSKPFPIAKERIETQGLNLEAQPTLWLYAPESFFGQSYAAELSNDPTILTREVYEIAQTAAKRKFEIISVRDGMQPLKFKIVRKEDKRKEDNPLEPLKPLETVNFLGSFQSNLEKLGFTVIPA